MAAPVITLADDLVSKLNTQTGYTFERRQAPYLNRSLLTSGKWIVVPAGDSQEIGARKVDKTTLTVDVGYQEALPAKTDAEPDPIENQTFFDDRMSKLEVVKALFRGEGALRNADFNPSSSFVFQSMNNTPIYRPDLMNDHQIFTAVIRLEFLGEIA